MEEVGEGEGVGLLGEVFGCDGVGDDLLEGLEEGGFSGAGVACDVGEGCGLDLIEKFVGGFVCLGVIFTLGGGGDEAEGEGGLEGAFGWGDGGWGLGWFWERARGFF